MRTQGGSDANNARHEDLVFFEDLEYKRPRAASAAGGKGKKKRTKYASKTKKGKKNAASKPKGGGGGNLFQNASGGMFRVRS
jgi:hypothetical protein